MTEQKKRGRPPQDKGEKSDKMDILDEMEQNAQKRIKGAGRVTLAPKLKLEWTDQDPNFHYQWASDSPEYPVSLQDMCEAGYTFVRLKHGAMRGERVVKASKGVNLYLMRQPKEYFLEDQEEKFKKDKAIYDQTQEVGKREYAGESKELGKGKVTKLSYEENPDAISLMDGE